MHWLPKYAITLRTCFTVQKENLFKLSCELLQLYMNKLSHGHPHLHISDQKHGPPSHDESQTDTTCLFVKDQRESKMAIKN